MRKPMSTDMAKIYNSHNSIPREMVTLLNGCFSTLPACEIFHYFIPREMVTLLSGRLFPCPRVKNFIIFIPKPVSKCPKMLYTIKL